MSDKQKNIQLGMPIGTATAQLKKRILFHLIKQLKKNVCFRCIKKIKTVDEFSIDHKKAWLYVNTDLFWDLKNVAFSHLKCNVAAARPRQKTKIHGTCINYRYGCRCRKCKYAMMSYRKSGKWVNIHP